MPQALARLQDDNLSKSTCAVRSSGSERRRTVKPSKRGWSCKCPYTTFRKLHCKHIRAVEAVCLLPESEQKAPTVRDPIPENACAHCSTAGATKASVPENENYCNPIYKCCSCGRRLSANLEFEKIIALPGIVSRAINDVYLGKSAGKIARGLNNEMAHSLSRQTVCNWARRGADMTERFVEGLNPCLGEKIRADGMRVRISGTPAYLHLAMDDAARCRA